MKHVFSFLEELKQVDNENIYWNSFIEQPGFEVGVLKLRVNEKDIQNPHKTDEVYFILEGDGKLNINGENFDIKLKNIYYIPRNTPHHFHSNSKDIVAFYVLN